MHPGRLDIIELPDASHLLARLERDWATSNPTTICECGLLPVPLGLLSRHADLGSPLARIGQSHRESGRLKQRSTTTTPSISCRRKQLRRSISYAWPVNARATS